MAENNYNGSIAWWLRIIW